MLEMVTLAYVCWLDDVFITLVSYLASFTTTLMLRSLIFPQAATMQNKQ